MNFRRENELHTNDNHVKLETTLQELVLNLLRDGVKTDVGVGTDLFSGGHGERTRSGRLKREERTAGRSDAEGGRWTWTTTETAVNARKRPNFLFPLGNQP